MPSPRPTHSWYHFDSKLSLALPFDICTLVLVSQYLLDIFFCSKMIMVIFLLGQLALTSVAFLPTNETSVSKQELLIASKWSLSFLFSFFFIIIFLLLEQIIILPLCPKLWFKNL